MIEDDDDDDLDEEEEGEEEIYSKVGEVCRQLFA